MRASQAGPDSLHPRPLRVVLGSALAVGLAVLALVSVFFGLQPGANAADRATALPNLLTGIASVLGAAGYWRGKRWGPYAFAASVAGHVLIHSAFVISALAQGRLSPLSLAILAAVPIVSLLLFAVMLRDWRQRRLS